MCGTTQWTTLYALLVRLCVTSLIYALKRPGYRVYLTVASLCFAISGWKFLLLALSWNNVSVLSPNVSREYSTVHYAHFQDPWTHWCPAITFLLTYILATVLGFAVSIMGLWHLWSVARGETSVEAQDHEVYRKVAKGRGEVIFLLFSPFPCLTILHPQPQGFCKFIRFGEEEEHPTVFQHWSQRIVCVPLGLLPF